MLRISPRILCPKKSVKNVKHLKKGDENLKDARQNSEQNRLVQTSRGPLIDHFPGFNDFVKIGQNGIHPTPPPRAQGDPT